MLQAQSRLTQNNGIGQTEQATVPAQRQVPRWPKPGAPVPHSVDHATSAPSPAYGGHPVPHSVDHADALLTPPGPQSIARIGRALFLLRCLGPKGRAQPGILASSPQPTAVIPREQGRQPLYLLQSPLYPGDCPGYAVQSQAGNRLPPCPMQTGKQVAPYRAAVPKFRFRVP